MKKVIIRCKSKTEPNWSGKEFSLLPAKIYNRFQDATDALDSYWFCEGAQENNNYDTREITITHLSELKVLRLLSKGKIMY